MTSHAGPVPTFDTLITYFNGGFSAGNIAYMIMISLATAATVFFLIKHFATLIKELKNYSKFKKTEEFTKLKNSNAEVTLMTLPLTFAMSMNVAFIAMILFVP